MNDPELFYFLCSIIERSGLHMLHSAWIINRSIRNWMWRITSSRESISPESCTNYHAARMKRRKSPGLQSNVAGCPDSLDIRYIFLECFTLYGYIVCTNDSLMAGRTPW